MNNKAIGKLLAKENITIQHGNYQTAWFDIKNRVLGLPLWADNGKDVYDLLIGHEVGHALYTPYEGWHDSPEKLEGCPRSYINVIEDARIEKLIRRSYPGLVGPFLRGYKALSEQEFFGDLDNLAFDEIRLIDKINLKAKLGREVNIPLNSEEQVLFNRAMNTETFEEVVQLVKDVYDYTKENQSELLEQNQDQPQNDNNIPEEFGDEQMPPSGHDDQLPGEDSAETQAENAPVSDDTGNDGEEESSSSTVESNDQSEKDEESASSSVTDKPSENDMDQSVTDEIFRAKESGLVEVDRHGQQTLFCGGVTKSTASQIVIDYKTLAQDREATKNRTKSTVLQTQEKEFKQYMKDTRKNTNFAIKEFEMRKAAHQWQRASTAKSGSLDVNKVHGYKFNEDIFARVTSLADSKNHGMMMIVDYSGSMSESMPYVIDQLMHLVVFCKAVNIPFEVYAFTTGNPNFRNRHKEEFENMNDGPAKDALIAEIVAHNKKVTTNLQAYKDGALDMDNMSMPLLVSSSLKKADYTMAMAHLYGKKTASYWYGDSFESKFEQWGSTPLNHALIISHELIKKFKAKHSVEKMNFVCLSDGDTNAMHVYSDRKLESKKADTTSSYSSRNGMNLKVDNKILKLHDNRSGGTKELLQSIQKRYNVNTLGFFMADDSRHFMNRIQSAHTDGQRNGGYMDYYSEEYMDLKKNANAEYRKNKCVIKENVLGYNEYYIIKGGRALSAQGESTMDKVSSDNTTAQIRNAFKKSAKSKKTNKVLLTRFGKAVA